MIKFAKFMYELGYKSALKEVLRAVDDIPNEKPRESDFEVRSEELMKKRMRIAMAVFDERRQFKHYIHQKFDPTYTPDIERLDELVRRREL